MAEQNKTQKPPPKSAVARFVWDPEDLTTPDGKTLGQVLKEALKAKLGKEKK